MTATATTAPVPARGRGRPAIGDRITVRLPHHIVECLDIEADRLGWKRAELIRSIVADRYAVHQS